MLETFSDLNMIMVDRFRVYDTKRKVFKIANKSQEDINNAMGKAVVDSKFAEDRRIVMVASTSYASRFVQDALLDFVFIDADHSYESVKRDIKDWYLKVRPGGLVSGHDYGGVLDKAHHSNVKGAVDEFVDEHEYEVQVITKHRIWWFRKHEN